MSPYQPKPNEPFAEIHTVETPEQIHLEFPLAGIGSRCLALCLDLLIQVGVSVVLLILFLVFTATTSLRTPWVGALLIGAFFLLQFGYFIGFEIVWNGQTPGKRWIGLRAIKDSGRPLSAGETVARNLLRIVDQLPGVYGVGLVAMIFSKSNKRLGDMVAGSVVIREAAVEDARLAWSAGPVAGPELPLGANLLSPADLALVDSFLARRDQLDGATRSRMADQIVAHLGQKLHLNGEQMHKAETTLETLAWESRGRG
jgi:uncharacterized RDD family membrane protein YckC